MLPSSRQTAQVPSGLRNRLLSSQVLIMPPPRTGRCQATSSVDRALDRGCKCNTASRKPDTKPPRGKNISLLPPSGYSSLATDLPVIEIQAGTCKNVSEALITRAPVKTKARRREARRNELNRDRTDSALCSPFLRATATFFRMNFIP